MAVSKWVARWADFSPDKTALICDEHAISYRALEERIAQTAGGLAARGVAAGARVAYLGLNSPELLISLLACARIGAIFVPLNWRLAPPEIVYILDNSDPTLVIADATFREAALEASTAASQPVLDPTDLLGNGSPIAGDQTAGDASVLIIYTSGTTGRPKGAVLDQDALFWNAVNSTQMHDLTSADHVLATVPMFHVGGLNIHALPALHAGATTTIHRRFDAGVALATIASARPTLTAAVPTQMAALSEHPDWAATDLSSLRMVTTGSTIVPVTLIERFHARGVPVVQLYGASETGPIAIYLRAEQARAHAGSAGKPAVHCDIRFVDNAGKDVVGDTRGEIWVRGPNVTRGYWRDPDSSRAALIDGWFRTGDIGHRDADGFVYIDDRQKDVIISGGENIYPAELEMILAECQDIAEAAVVGHADERWGEVPVAVVVRRPGCDIDEAGVTALLADRIARFKQPRRVLFVESLPRNSLGKVQKHTLREQTEPAV